MNTYNIEQEDSYSCKDCGKTVYSSDFKDYESFRAMMNGLKLCGKCYYDPERWGNE